MESNYRDGPMGHKNILLVSYLSYITASVVHLLCVANIGKLLLMKLYYL